MADKSHLVPVAELYARRMVLRQMDALEVEASSINSKTCTLKFSANLVGISLTFATERLEEIDMSGVMASYNMGDSTLGRADEEPEEEEDEEEDEPPKKPSKLKKKGGKK